MATDKKIDRFSASENAFPPQLGPISALPTDLILEVFSYLNQQECLRCMAVCRDWYIVVPAYTQHLWKEIRLNTNWIVEKNLRQERCLGSHVKRLVIEPPRDDRMERVVEEKELHTLIQKSLAWGCTEVESIELICCTTAYLYVFLDLLKLVLPRVERLAMIEHLSAIDIMSALYSLPDLTHFTYRHSLSSENEDVSYFSPLSISADYCTKLTYLWLDVDVPVSQKKLILKKCPDLLCYIDTTRSIKLEFSAVELDELFMWCPKITCLETNYFKHHQELDDYISNKSGLRYLNVCDGYELDQLSRHLTRNQGTLEFLYICGYEFDLLMASLHMQHLRTLICFLHTHISAATLSSLPKHCPALETFYLYSAQRLHLDSTFVQSLPKMRRLKHLRMKGVALDDELSLLTLLERFPILERLILRRMTLSVTLPDNFKSPSHLKHLELPEALWHGDSGNGQDREAEIAYFLRYLTYSSKIESIRLPNVPMIGRKSLLMITMIPTLKLLEVHVDYTLQEEELVEFIRMLRGTAVDTLTLGYVCSLTFAVLGALMELPYLKHLCTEGSGSSKSITRISKKGLQQILWKSPKLAQISFEDDIMLDDSKDVLTRNEIRRLISQLMPETGTLYPGFRHWRVRIDDTPSVRRVIFSSIPAPF